MLDDADALRERIAAAASGLLALLGIDADPMQQPRAHPALATCWTTPGAQGRDLDLAALIQPIQSPPFDEVGVLDLETFYPGQGAHSTWRCG